MSDIIKFLDVYYMEALKLHQKFNITKKGNWSSLVLLNEISVQLGHVYNILFPNKLVDETGRNIINLGDEISDVLLQLINLSKVLNINMYEIKYLNNYNYNDISGVNILLGQLTEVIMEMNQLRFKKERYGFDSSYEFAKDRLFKIFLIVYNFAKSNNLDIIKEFHLMIEDANKFLNSYTIKNNQEFIDIYNEKEEYIGYCEKDKAHQVGLWHRTFNCLVINPRKKTVFFQYKNMEHNGINKNKLLEITVGGHLQSGESISDGIREIKEEMGINIYFNQLIDMDFRKCNKRLNEEYIIKEFQYYYLLLKNIRIEEITNYDIKEVFGYVELKIEDAISLLEKKIDVIEGKIIHNNKISRILIKRSMFDSAFMGKTNLFLKWLKFAKGNIKKEKTEVM